MCKRRQLKPRDDAMSCEVRNARVPVRNAGRPRLGLDEVAIPHRLYISAEHLRVLSGAAAGVRVRIAVHTLDQDVSAGL